MEITKNTTIGEIVRTNFKTAQLFDSHKIDFCCAGDKTLTQACKKSGINVDELLPEIEFLIKNKDWDTKYIEGLSADALCDYIVNRHHNFIKEKVPFIQQKLNKLCDVHGNNYKELLEIRELFNEAAHALNKHLEKEETVLFPKISLLMSLGTYDYKNELIKSDIEHMIKQLKDEHKTEGERFEKISILTNNYTTPDDGCNTYEVTNRTLEEFEKDLHRHIHLENNVLFQKISELNQILTNNQ